MKLIKLYLILFLCLFHEFVIPIYGQTVTETKSWSDGDPVFNYANYEKDKFNFIINDSLYFAPTDSITSNDDSLHIILDGINWTWPRQSIDISSVEDIDSRTIGTQDLYLVTDALARRVFEMNPNPDDENIVWNFGSQNVWDVKYLERPVDADIFTENGLVKVLITDQGRHRVIKVDRQTQNVEWQYGDPNGLEGIGDNQLSNPADAVKIKGTNEFVIADRGNNRVIIVAEDTNQPVWEIDSNELNSPVDVEYIHSKNQILVTDRGNHRVIIVDRDSNNVVWQFGEKGVAGNDSLHLSTPIDADTLANGNILIADRGNNRIIEVNQDKEIVWQFERSLSGLRDVDRLDDNRHLAVYLDEDLNAFSPTRLGFQDSSVVSKVYDLNKEVVFNRIFWDADTLAGITSLKMQIHSANSLGELEIAPWMGPDGSTTYYHNSGEKLNSYHNGHRFYQFKVFLSTNNPLYTPVLNNVQLEYLYFNTTKIHHFYSQKITNTPGNIISQWKQLEFNTILPEDREKRDKIELEIQIVDGESPYQVLARYTASRTIEQNSYALDLESKLEGVQSVTLHGYASTINSSVAPILDYWKITWESVPISTSEIRFVNSKGANVNYYRATNILPADELKVDSLDIILQDNDQAPFNTVIELQAKALVSGDSEKVVLNLQTNGMFYQDNNIPLLISNQFTPNNQILEVLDRDTLVVTYYDNNHEGESASDTVVVIQNTPGELYIEDKEGTVLEDAKLGNILYFRIKNEFDQNLDPLKQESVKISLFDRATVDEEEIELFELEGPESNQWDTGEFISVDGVRIEKSNNGFKDDGAIQTLPGHRVTAEYEDNVILTKSVLLPDSGSTSDTYIYLGGAPVTVDVAPNPFYANEYDNFRLRVASATGTLSVRKLEVFNLAGELVRSIDRSQLNFDTGLDVPKERYGIAEHWWDLRNNNGSMVTSGTYWVKIHADLNHADTNKFESVTFIRKFVLVR